MDFKTIHDIQDKELAFVASQNKKEKMHVPMPKLSRARSTSYAHILTAYQATKRTARKTAQKIFMLEYFRELNEAYGWKFIITVISVYGINQGIGESFIFLARSYYLFDILGLEPYRAQALSALISVPWGMKPIYGLCSDVAPIFGLRRAPYIVLAAVLGTIAMIFLGTVYTLPVFVAAIFFILSNYSMASPDVIIDGAITEAIQKVPTQASNLQSLAWGSFAVCGFIASLCVGQVIDTVGPRDTFLIAIATLVPMGVFAGLHFLNETGGQKCGCNNTSRDDEFDLDFMDEFDANLYDEESALDAQKKIVEENERKLKDLEKKEAEKLAKRNNKTNNKKNNGKFNPGTTVNGNSSNTSSDNGEDSVSEHKGKIIELPNNYNNNNFIAKTLSPRKNMNTKKGESGAHYTSVGSVDISEVSVDLHPQLKDDVNIPNNGEEEKEDYLIGDGEELPPISPPKALSSHQSSKPFPINTDFAINNNYDTDDAPNTGKSNLSYLTEVDETRQKNIYILAVVIALCAVSSALSTNLLADYYRTQLAVTSGIAVLVAACLYFFLVPVSPVIAKAAIFFFITSAIQPSLGDQMFYWYTKSPNGPQFTPQFLGWITCVVMASMVGGIALYNTCFTKWRYRSIFLVTQILLFALSLTDWVFVNRWNLDIGINDHAFVIGTEVIDPIVNRLNSMPMFILSSRLCPEGCEATLFALFMALSNFGSDMAGCFGVGMLKAFGISREDETRLPDLVLLRSFFKLLPVLFLFLLPNSSPDEECVAMEREQSELSLKRAKSSMARLERARSQSQVVLPEGLDNSNSGRSKEIQKMLERGEGSIVEDRDD